MCVCVCVCTCMRACVCACVHACVIYDKRYTGDHNKIKKLLIVILNYRTEFLN